MIGIVINRGASEIIVNISTVKYTGEMTVEFAGTSLNGISVENMASLETAIAAYQPGGGGGGDYSQGYADGEAAMESTIASSQAVTANLYKSKLASEDATIAAADATDIDGQGTIFSESYSYLKTSAEMQDVYDDGYDEGYDDGIAAATGTPFTKDDFVQPATIYGNNVWTDGTNTYYSYLTDQYVLDNVSYVWRKKTWSGGLTSFEGSKVWTDGTNIYYSYLGTNYVLNVSTSTWIYKSWTGLTRFSGSEVWTDGTNIYYSSGSDQYVLDVATSTWTAKTWTGLTSFGGSNVWTDGTNIYYSSGSNQHVLDVATSTWTAKTWTGLTNFDGYNTWTDGTNIYYGTSNQQYILDIATSTWTQKIWTGYRQVNGTNVWTVGTNIYYSYGSSIYVIDIDTSTWSTTPMYFQSFPSGAKLYSNGTIYEFSDIDMSFKPVSNNP